MGYGSCLHLLPARSARHKEKPWICLYIRGCLAAPLEIIWLRVAQIKDMIFHAEVKPDDVHEVSGMCSVI